MASAALGALPAAALVLLAGCWGAAPSPAAFNVPTNVPSSVPGYTLEQVHAIFRHGNRTPEAPYPNDPNTNDTWYPTGWAQLSKAGIESSFRLGRAFRRRYDAFLGDTYLQDDVNATSTGVARAKLTLQAFMAGLFPAEAAEQRWDSAGSALGALWQPFEYHYMPVTQDDFLYMHSVPCPRYDAEYAEVLRGERVQAMLREDPELLAVLRQRCGAEYNQLNRLSLFYGTISIEKFGGRLVPDWVLPFWPERLERMAISYYHARVLTRSMQRLRAGPLVKHVVSSLQRRASTAEAGADTPTGPTPARPPRLWLYSAHDDTITQFGMALRCWGDAFPDFNAMLAVELLRRSATGEFAVQILQRENHNVPFHPVTVEGCTSPCPLKKFRELVEDVIPDDWRRECRAGPAGASSAAAMPSGTFSSLVAIAVMLFASLQV